MPCKAICWTVRCRETDGGPYNAAFWDAETPRFSMSRGPDWLKMGATTGVLTRTPDTQEVEHKVRITAKIPGVSTDEQLFRLHCLPVRKPLAAICLRILLRLRAERTEH